VQSFVQSLRRASCRASAELRAELHAKLRAEPRAKPRVKLRAEPPYAELYEYLPNSAEFCPILLGWGRKAQYRALLSLSIVIFYAFSIG